MSHFSCAEQNSKVRLHVWIRCGKSKIRSGRRFDSTEFGELRDQKTVCFQTSNFACPKSMHNLFSIPPCRVLIKRQSLGAFLAGMHLWAGIWREHSHTHTHAQAFLRCEVIRRRNWYIARTIFRTLQPLKKKEESRPFCRAKRTCVEEFPPAG